MSSVNDITFSFVFLVNVCTKIYTNKKLITFCDCTKTILQNF